MSSQVALRYLFGEDTPQSEMDVDETEGEDEIFMFVDRSSVSSTNTNYTFPSSNSDQRRSRSSSSSSSTTTTTSTSSEELSDRTALYYEGSASEYTSDGDAEREDEAQLQLHDLSPLSSVSISTVSTAVETPHSAFLSTPLVSSDHLPQANPLSGIAPAPCTGRSCEVKAKLSRYHHRIFVWTLPRNKPRGIHEKRFRIFLQDFYETMTQFTSWHEEDYEQLRVVMHQIVEALSVVLYTVPGSQSTFDKKRTELTEKVYEIFIDMHLLTLVDLEDLRKKLIGKLSS